MGIEFGALLTRVKRLSFNPHQKVMLTSTYLVPMAAPPITLLRRLDKKLRVVTKDIFNLPLSTANGLLYCSRRNWVYLS